MDRRAIIDERIKHLLINTDLTFKQIIEKLRSENMTTSFNTIRRVNKNYQYRKPRNDAKLTPQQRKELILILKNNAKPNLSALARRYGVCHGSIWYWWDKLTKLKSNNDRRRGDSRSGSRLSEHGSNDFDDYADDQDVPANSNQHLSYSYNTFNRKTIFTTAENEEDDDDDDNDNDDDVDNDIEDEADPLDLSDTDQLASAGARLLSALSAGVDLRTNAQVANDDEPIADDVDDDDEDNDDGQNDFVDDDFDLTEGSGNQGGQSSDRTSGELKYSTTINLNEVTMVGHVQAKNHCGEYVRLPIAMYAPIMTAKIGSHSSAKSSPSSLSSTSRRTSANTTDHSSISFSSKCSESPSTSSRGSRPSSSFATSSLSSGSLLKRLKSDSS